MAGDCVSSSLLEWPSQEAVAHLQRSDALVLRLPAASSSGISGSVLVLRSRPNGTTAWREQTIPFSRDLFVLDGLTAETEYELRLAERTSSGQSSFGGILRLTTNKASKHVSKQPCTTSSCYILHRWGRVRLQAEVTLV